jgi:hypothetical protein
MKKNIACPSCKGNGFRTIITGDRNDYCGIGSEKCYACDGTGVQEVDMTNADRIRAMSDEELAELFRDIYNAGGEYAENWYVNGSRQSCFEWDEEWLKQPVEVE